MGGKSGGGDDSRSGGGSTTVTTGQSEPWAPTGEAMRRVYERAASLLDADRLGGGVAPVSSQTQDAIDTILSNATRTLQGQATAPTQANDLALRTLRGDFLRANPAFGYLSPWASGDFANAPDGYGALAATARGDYLPGRAGGNPWLDALVRRTSGLIGQETASRANAAGRYGSGADLYALQSNVGDAAAKLYGAAWDAERNRQQQAQQALGTAQANAAGLLSGDWNAERSLMQGAMADAGAINAALYDDPMRALQIGTMLDQRAQAMRDSPFANLRAYAALVGGLPSVGGQTTGTSRSSSQLGANAAYGGALRNAGGTLDLLGAVPQLFGLFG